MVSVIEYIETLNHHNSPTLDLVRPTTRKRSTGLHLSRMQKISEERVFSLQSKSLPEQRLHFPVDSIVD